MRRIMVTVSTFVLLALLLALVVSCGRGDSRQDTTLAENTLSKILNEKKLRVAYIHYPPSAYRDTDTGEVTGLFVDILEDIVRQLDPSIEIEYEETTWADFSAALTTRRVDLSIAGTFTTVPRAKVVAFTQPIVYLGRSAIVKKDDHRFNSSSPPEQFDREGIKIGVVSGEGSHEYVKANFEHQKNITVFTGSDLSQCLAAVSSGQVDVGMSDALETQKYAKVHPEIVDLYAERPYNLTPISWAVRQQDRSWLGFLNTAIHTLEAQGMVAQWEQKYDFRWTHPKIDYGPR